MTSAAHTLDTGPLSTYLAEHISGFTPIQKATKFSGGQSNPTFLLETGNDKYVLRRKPPGTLLKSAHAVDREYRVQKALWESAVPVAKTYHLCLDDSVIGSWFYVMEYKQGRIFWDAALPDFSPRTRGKFYDEMNHVLSLIHAADIDAAGLTDFGKPGNYFERQLGRWTKQYRASQMDKIEDMETLLAYLPAHMPPDDGQVSLIHGDYRLDNLMFHPDRPEVIAVFDWELSTLGHPLADLAYQCMLWRMGQDWPIKGLAGIDLEHAGIPSEASYVAAYCKRTGLSEITDWSFYMAFSFFRMAAICQGVAKRAALGNASNAQAHKIGTMAAPLAKLGINAIG